MPPESASSLAPAYTDAGEPARLQATLQQLRGADRSAWRCLCAAAEFSDFAHLARRLHCNQGTLKLRLQQLSEALGAQHLALQDGKVLTSPQLLSAISQAALLLSSRPAARRSKTVSEIDVRLIHDEAPSHQQRP